MSDKVNEVKGQKINTVTVQSQNATPQTIGYLVQEKGGVKGDEYLLSSVNLQDNLQSQGQNTFACPSIWNPDASKLLIGCPCDSNNCDKVHCFSDK